MDFSFFWNGWQPLIRILVVGTIAYISVVLVLRTFGKRTLGSMNGYDFVTTVAMGAVFGGSLISNRVSVSEALLAFALLVFLQFLITHSELRHGWLTRYITTKPTILFYRGEFYKRTMKKERVLKNDLISMVRKKGFASLDDVEAIIMETDGSFSIIKPGTRGLSESVYASLDNFNDEIGSKN